MTFTVEHLLPPPPDEIMAARAELRRQLLEAGLSPGEATEFFRLMAYEADSDPYILRVGGSGRRMRYKLNLWRKLERRGLIEVVPGKEPGTYLGRIVTN